MKEIVNISINGVPFSLEKQAYAALESFINSQCSDENFEQKVADKLLEINGNERVVSDSCVERLIIEFGGNAKQFFPDAENTSSKEPKTAPRRLTRNMNGAMFGGVCKGLAQYFRTDVILWRFIFIILFLLGNSFWWVWGLTLGSHLIGLGPFNMMALVAYIVLWAILPQGEDAPQKASSAGYVARSIFTVLKTIIIIILSICFGLCMAAIAITVVTFNAQIGAADPAVAQFLDIISISYPVAIGLVIALVVLPIIIVFNILITLFKGATNPLWGALVLFVIWICVVVFCSTLVSGHITEINSIDWSGCEDWCENWRFLHISFRELLSIRFQFHKSF